MSKPQRAAISADGHELVAHHVHVGAGPSAFGTWLRGDHGTSEAAITGQLPVCSGASLSCQPSWVEPFGPEWPICAQIFASVSACTKSTSRFQATSCSGA